MKIKAAYLILIIISLACTTVKETTRVTPIKEKLPERNIEFRNLALKTTISASVSSQSNLVTAKINLAYLDSMSVSLYGPFGITVGKLYADTNNLVFFNSLTNQVLEGKPVEENMRMAVMLPLSYFDFVRLIRCETPGEPADFIFAKKINEDELLFKNDKHPDYIEYAVLSSKQNVISQYQRKLIDGTLILHVYFVDYQLVNNVYYSMKQLYKFPEINANLTLEINDIEINSVFEKPFTFAVPGNIQRINLNKQ
ncbi:DUF4292 domain-containing protein [Bacteroidota bacterium]